MEYRRLGRTNVKVSPLCLGCMNFGAGTPEDESIRIIHAALDAGINFLDTANVYSRGVSEIITGKALKGRRRDQIILATKVHGRMGDAPNEAPSNSRHMIMWQVEESLRRLGTDYIDLYQIHRPDPDTPIEESLRALDDLIRQGKVRYIGCSTFPAWQIMEALWASEKMNLERFATEQPPYHIFDRRIENEVLPLAAKYGLAILPWSPTASGWLTGRYRKGQSLPEGTRNRKVDLESPSALQRLDAIEQLVALSDVKGVPLSQFALAWNLHQPGITSPIIGPRTMEHLADCLKALEVQVTAEDRAAVDQIVAPGSAI
jgi:aryl-alcohol dehydrogenase-like predicted oxidoreductase